MFSELSDKQLDRLSEFCANLALVYIAAVITPMFSGVDSIGLNRVVFGLTLAAGSLVLSLIFAKQGRP